MKRTIHGKAIIVEGHRDLFEMTRLTREGHKYPLLNVTLPRLKRANISTTFYSIAGDSVTHSRGTRQFLKSALENIDMLREEIEACGSWLDAEIALLRPELVLPVGKLAIRQFAEFEKLDAVVGRTLSASRAGHTFELIPLPHPSGASTWHRTEPGRGLLARALRAIARHPAMADRRG